MNVHLLIDAVVRQTTVLLAQLATSGGARAALGHTANQVFLDLTAELRRQGLNNKLIADLFGLSLRTYHNRVQRLSESSTDRGIPLWNAVLEFIQSQGTVARAEVLMRFCRDEDATVRSVLNDLVEAGLVFSKGGGDRLAYRAAEREEIGIGQSAGAAETRENLVWILIARRSPLSRSALLDLSQLEATNLDLALKPLLADGRVVEHKPADEIEYSSPSCVFRLGQSAGWEASVLDHYQAVVGAICSKLALGGSDLGREAQSARHEQIGGSTYSVQIWPGHPLYEQALAQLKTMREQAASLRVQVDAVNASLERPAEGVCRVVTYVGQNVIDLSDTMETEA